MGLFTAREVGEWGIYDETGHREDNDGIVDNGMAGYRERWSQETGG